MKPCFAFLYTGVNFGWHLHGYCFLWSNIFLIKKVPLWFYKYSRYYYFDFVPRWQQKRFDFSNTFRWLYLCGTVLHIYLNIIWLLPHWLQCM